MFNLWALRLRVRHLGLNGFNNVFIFPLSSFYVGDAAGRPNDHSDADIKFADVTNFLAY